MKRLAPGLVALLICAAGCTPSGPGQSAAGGSVRTPVTASTSTPSAVIAPPRTCVNCSRAFQASVVTQTQRSIPPTSVMPTLTGAPTPNLLRAAWNPSGTRLYVEHWGSTYCDDTVLVRAAVTAQQTITLDTTYDETKKTFGSTVVLACTADLGPTTWVLAPGPGIDAHRPVTVVDDEATATAPPIG